LQLSSDVNTTDLVITPNPQRNWQNSKLDLRYRGEKINASAEYRNTSFGGEQLMGLYPAWAPLDSQQRIMQHQALIAADAQISIVKADVHAQMKNLSYTLWQLDPDTFELVNQGRTNINDLYYGGNLRVNIIKGFEAHLGYDFKNSLYTSLDEYKQTSFGAGLGAEYALPLNGVLTASLDWKKRDTVALGDQKTHLIRTTLRYQQKLTSNIAGYFYYINNSCLDRGLDTLYLISNIARAQVLYTFPFDESCGSYILLGAKFSPENNSSAYFAETDNRIWQKLYAGASVSFQPERQTTLACKLSYHYTAANEIHLQLQNRNNTHEGFNTNALTLGSSFYW
jgi:hypothetical protein